MTQADRILELLLLRGGQGLNATELLAPNVVDGGPPIMRTAARVEELRKGFYGIETRLEANGTATYTLTSGCRCA